LLDARAPTPGQQDVPPWVERAVLCCWGGGQRLGRYLRRGPGSGPIRDAFGLRLAPSPRLPWLLVQLAAFVQRKVPYALRWLVRCPRVARPFTVHRGRP
jgi:hypothetical protein